MGQFSPPKCPECGATHHWRFADHLPRQCRDCGPKLSVAKIVNKPLGGLECYDIIGVAVQDLLVSSEAVLTDEAKQDLDSLSHLLKLVLGLPVERTNA